MSVIVVVVDDVSCCSSSWTDGDADAVVVMDDDDVKFEFELFELFKFFADEVLLFEVVLEVLEARLLLPAVASSEDPGEAAAMGSGTVTTDDLCDGDGDDDGDDVVVVIDDGTPR